MSEFQTIPFQLPLESILIEEIGQMSANARTKPFKCKDSDGALYYVKTKEAGGTSLCYEWNTANLARIFELPIPDFHIAEIPEMLITYSMSEDIKNYCKSGFAFASLAVDYTQDISFEQLRLVDKELRAKILLFDWAVQNIDRMISQKGGNPNLLFNATHKQIYIIDHNLAFDTDLSKDMFWKEHPFAQDVKYWDEPFKAMAIVYLDRCVEELEVICDELPVEWYAHIDIDDEVEKLTECFNNVKAILIKYKNSSFWEQ